MRKRIAAVITVILALVLGLAIFTACKAKKSAVTLSETAITIEVGGTHRLEAVAADGFLGVLTGGLKATAGGITAALVFGYLACLIFKGKPKS